MTILGFWVFGFFKKIVVAFFTIKASLLSILFIFFDSFLNGCHPLDGGWGLWPTLMFWVLRQINYLDGLGNTAERLSLGVRYRIDLLLHHIHHLPNSPNSLKTTSDHHHHLHSLNSTESHLWHNPKATETNNLPTSFLICCVNNNKNP